MTIAGHAISGLKVVDLSRVLGGPYCTQILADHGADVIKIEPPGGDETRYWGPPFADGIASYFIGVNRNKRSLSLNLKSEAGREVLLKLIADADILIENFKPGTMEQWGLGYHDRLAAEFPQLVYCRISGYGSDGPLGGFPGYDAVLVAMSGLMSANGDKSTGPMRLGVPVVDLSCGLYSAIGILMAVIERQRSGLGQFLDMTLFDSAYAVMHPHAANYFLSGRDPERTGNAHPNICPYDKFATKSVEIFLAIGNDRAFRILCKRLGNETLADDPRFGTNADRVTNRAALTEILQDRLAEEEGEAFCLDLLAIGIPAGPVLPPSAALASAHAAARGTIEEAPSYKGISSPIRLSRTPSVGVRERPPQLGAHSRAILAEAGLTTDEIEKLIADGDVKTS